MLKQKNQLLSRQRILSFLFQIPLTFLFDLVIIKIDNNPSLQHSFLPINEKQYRDTINTLLPNALLKPSISTLNTSEIKY